MLNNILYSINDKIKRTNIFRNNKLLAISRSQNNYVGFLA